MKILRQQHTHENEFKKKDFIKLVSKIDKIYFFFYF